MRSLRMETKRQAVTVARWIPLSDVIADRWGGLASLSPRSVRANDLWIAATSLELGLTLVTGDAKLAKLVEYHGFEAVLVRP